MAKRFKLRISKVIPSFQSCCSKEPSTLPQHPVPLFSLLSSSSPTVDNYNSHLTPPPQTSHHPHLSSFNRHVSSAFLSLGCGLGSKSSARDDCRTEASLDFHWEKEDQWHVVAKIYDESSTIPRQKIYNSSVSGDSDDDSGLIPQSLLPLPPPKKRRGKIKKKRYSSFRHRISTSSAESGMFSTSSFDELREHEEEEEETETLISSSRSFSTDSSTDFNPQLETIRETTPNPRPPRRRHRKKKITAAMCRTTSVKSPECGSPARLSVFKKLIPVEGKVKESFAVVKKSEDPYEDFKKSMMEMVLEKQIFDEKDLEQLLQCFLSLNSRFHHDVIIEAFSEIWDTIFGSTAGRNSYSTNGRVSEDLVKPN